MMNMDIDNNVIMNDIKVTVHPLAIVNMADHYTRITCGGSPLPSSTTVMGLVFGTIRTETSTTTAATATETMMTDETKLTTTTTTSTAVVQIQDSSDVLFTQPDEAARQIELHRAVFPNHQVIGWYKVIGTNQPGGTSSNHGLSTEPSMEDYQMAQLLHSQYQPNSLSTGQQQQQQHPGNIPLLLIWLRAKQDKNDDESNENQAMDKSVNEPPLMIYQVVSSSARTAITGGSHTTNNLLFCAMEDWILDTSRAEKIGLEHVVRFQPSRGQPQSDVTMDPSDSQYILYCQQVSEAWAMMNSRFVIIQQYLEMIQKQDLEKSAPSTATAATQSDLQHHELLRRVRALLWQFKPLMATMPSSISSTRLVEEGDGLIPRLALLGRTLESAQSYIDKMRLVLADVRPVLREGRRGGTAES